jgi:DeoR/GlpR family transcriptional regulator of sugar metabolism
MIPVERQQRILQLLAERGVVSIVELTDWLQVSHMTIRRDIQKLEEQGRVLSVSGGVSLSQRIKSEPSHAAKRSLMQGAKLAIARLAAAQVSEGSTVYLDAGTTSLELARELALREDLMIVTNDFMVCAYLIEHGRCRLYHTGGQVIRENQSCAGTETLRPLTDTPGWPLRRLTGSDLLEGITSDGVMATTETLLIRGKSRTIRRIKSIHFLDRKDSVVRDIIL